MSQMSPRRRFVLRSLAGSLALPAVSSLAADSGGHSRDPVAAADVGIGRSPNQRFVAIGNLLGFQQKSFFPETEGKQFESTPLLDPLSDNRDHFTVYRGLDHGIRGGHFAVHTFLSGVLHHEAKQRRDANVTIDQFIADRIGRNTRFASLTVGSEGGIHGGCQLSWTKSGVRVPPITGPAELFDRLFTTESAKRQSQLQREHSLQASILDSMTEEAGWLAKRVNVEDKNKLDEYFSSIRDVEKRLQARKRWSGQAKPDAPLERPSNTNTVDDLPLLYELIALALQTDSTRVATLEIGGCFLPQDLGIKKSYHSLSHHGNDEEAIANLITLETYQVKQFNQFLTRLRGMNDGNESLLDTTAVLFGSGMGDGNSHKNSDLPIVLAGGGYGNGEFRRVSNHGLAKVPLCNLFVDIASRMGVDAESFGTSTGTFA